MAQRWLQNQGLLGAPEGAPEQKAPGSEVMGTQVQKRKLRPRSLCCWAEDQGLPPFNRGSQVAPLAIPQNPKN